MLRALLSLFIYLIVGNPGTEITVTEELRLILREEFTEFNCSLQITRRNDVGVT